MTNWTSFRKTLQATLILQAPLKMEHNIEDCAPSSPKNPTSCLELYLASPHPFAHEYMYPSDKTENCGEEKAAQRVANHQVAAR
jgi:hypothetical protein